MGDIVPASPFDAIRHVDDHGEHWTARELMTLLGYTKWERFEDAIERARVSIASSGGASDQHASRSREASGKTERNNYRLTRYGAYMTAMNGDVRKPPIAAAQSYFAVKAREAEVRNEAIERAEVARAQLSMLQAAEGLAGIDRDWLKAKERAVVARGLGEEPEIDPLDVPLYVPDFIKAKGVAAKRDIESIQSWFGRRVASLYEAEYGEKPGKRQSELPNGQIRETYAWTKRHLPFFDEAWDRWYAAEYTPQGELNLIDGGAA